jgi:uncharacterized protein
LHHSAGDVNQPLVDISQTVLQDSETAKTMIHEGVITTLNTDGSAHVTPMGFVRDGSRVDIAPFVPSTTLDNLRRHPQAVMNLTDDVRIIAGALTGRRDWPVTAARAVTGWRLVDTLVHLELEVREHDPDAVRPAFRLAVLHEQHHREFRGFNRAQAAVVEGAILVSRLDFIDPGKLAAEITYLHIAVAKTAGDNERRAWRWLLDAIAAHPRHALAVDALYCD